MLKHRINQNNDIHIDPKWAITYNEPNFIQSKAL